MVEALIGKMSQGKTVTQVRKGFIEGKKGTKIFSNFKINYPSFINHEYIRNDRLIELLKNNIENEDYIKNYFKNSLFLLDEVSTLINARRSGSGLNEFILNFLVNTQKFQCDLIYTAQVLESQADKVLRMNTSYFTYCFRFTKEFGIVPIGRRILNEKVYIVLFTDIDFGPLGTIRKREIYDPLPYFKYYDTTEAMLFDRSKYLAGGTKDLKKW